MAQPLSRIDQALADKREILRAVAVLAASGQVVELRALKATEVGRSYRFTASGYYDNWEALARDAAALSGRAESVYITLNPANPALQARANNRYRQCRDDDPTTSDKDILFRRWLLLDFDYDRPKGISSTDAEHDVALELATKVRDWLAARGWPEPVEADSGNGGHLLYRIDLPNDDASRELAQRCLEALAWRFNDHVKVDTSVFNAGRICKLYGTLAAKGDNTPDRPHRLARIFKAPRELAVVSREQLQALAAELPKVEEPTRTTYNGAGQPYDVERFIRANGLQVAREGSWKDGRRWVLKECPFNAEHRDKSAYILQLGNGAVAAGCHHDSCQGWDWVELRAKYEPARPALSIVSAPPPQPSVNGKHAAPKATPPPVATAPAADDERPVVQVLAGRGHEAIEAIVQHIVTAQAADPRFFRQGGVTELYHLASVDREGQPHKTIVPAEPAYVRNAITRTVALESWNERKHGFAATNPTEVLVNGVHTYLPEHCPVLDGVTEIPVFRPDGTLQTTPGYDPVTRIYYQPVPGLVIPEVSMQPIPQARADALALIEELIQDFPFAGPAERHNAIALYLLPYAKAFINDATPLHVLEAPTPGSGKGKLANSLLLPAYGQIGKGKEPKDETEASKWLISQAQARKPVCYIDNVRTGLDSGELASAITETWLSGRLLGTNTIVDLHYAPIWLATANNPTLTDEIARRTVRIRLEPATDRPGIRPQSDFHHMLPDWAEEHRAALVHAGLTLVAVWLAVGRPSAPHKRNKGSFTNWARVMGGILHVAGLDEFLANEDAVWNNANAEAGIEADFVELWATKHGYASSNMAKDLIEIADEAGLIVKNEKGSPTRKLGRLLIGLRDRLFTRANGERVQIKQVGQRKNALIYGLRLVEGAGKPSSSAPKPPDGEFGEFGEFAPNPHVDFAYQHTNTAKYTRGIEINSLNSPNSPENTDPPGPCDGCGSTNWRYNSALRAWQCPNPSCDTLIIIEIPPTTA